MSQADCKNKTSLLQAWLHIISVREGQAILQHLKPSKTAFYFMDFN